MFGDLTERQYGVLKFIVKMVEKEGYPPTIREIGKCFSISSTLGVRRHLIALQKKGYIRRKEWQSRGIELVKERVSKLFLGQQCLPLVGSVAAGKPICAVENIEGVLSLENLFPENDGHFALRVNGDSMEGAGIFAGDIVIVRQQPSAEIGDIVVAFIGEEATIKRLARFGEQIGLEPANPRYEPIIAQEAEIVGKVVGLIRKIK